MTNQLTRYKEHSNHVATFTHYSGKQSSIIGSDYRPYLILSGSTLLGFTNENDFNDWIDSFGKRLDNYVIISKK